MRTFILLILIFHAIASSSQGPGSVRGKLIDSSGTQSLNQATISLLKASDSSFVNYAVAGKSGEFAIGHLLPGDYLLVISHQGFNDLKAVFSIRTGKEAIELGELFMTKAYLSLSEAVVSSQTAVRIKDDTVSFSMTAFKNSPGATLEDALKKLPGLQVQKDGTIRAMGETVQKLYVDGKEFFSNDPSMAAKNLTADMVEQVQVFDDMSEQAKFTRIDDGSRSKSLNIKLKKDRKKGDFGKLLAGAGTHNRYESQLSMNHFSATQKISLAAAASNTNKFSYQFGSPSSSGSSTFSNGSGSPGRPGSGTGTGGINESASGGINYSDEWGPVMDFRGSYQYASNNNRLDQNSFRKYSFPADSSSITNTGSTGRNRNSNHRVNARWEYRIDSFQSVLYTANLAIQEADLLYTDSTLTLSEAGKTYLAITGTNHRNDDRDASNFGGELLYRRRFRVAGRSFTWGWKNNYTGYGSLNLLRSLIRTYDPSGLPNGLINPDQQTGVRTNSSNNTFTASLTEPAGSNKLFEFNYTHSINKSSADRKVFDFNTLSGKYDRANLYQTNYFDVVQFSGRAGVNFRMAKKYFNYQLGASVQWSESRAGSAGASTDTVIRQRYTNFFPSASFNYTISRNSTIRFYYRGRTNMPSVTQLQDARDISNPLQVRTGNPGLKQEFISNFNLNYNNFNIRSTVFFNASASLNVTGNKIINSIDSLQSAVMIIRPENQPGSYNGSGLINIGGPLKKLKGASLNFTSMVYSSRDVNLLFKKKNFTSLLVLDQSAGFSYTAEKFDLDLGGSLVYNSLQYDLQPGAGTSYCKAGWSAGGTYRFNHDFFLVTNLEHINHTGRTKDYNGKILLWNMAFAKQFLKNRAAEIKITAYDILKQDQGISRLTGDNYLEDTRAVVTPGFFLLSLSYNFRHTGNKNSAKQQPAPKLPAEKMLLFSN